MPISRFSHCQWCFFGLLLMQMSCAQNKTMQSFSNPMDAVWSKIGGRIDELEDEHANEDDWRKVSEPLPEVVSSISDLHVRTKDLEITAAEREVLSAAFNKSSRVVNFGFECNYHALVFFDQAGKCWKVIKW